MSSASSRLTVPPADAKLANALMFGISTLSTTKRFSSGLPPRTMRSLRKSFDADHDAGKRLHVARHVLQGAGALEDLARRHEKARVLHLLGRLERRRGHRDRLLKVLHLGQRHLDGPVQPGTDVHLVAGEGQAFEGQNLEPIRSGAQLADAEPPRASLVAQEAVSRAHTRTPSAGRPAASTTTPVMAPTAVVSCAAAEAATTASTMALSAGTGTRKKAPAGEYGHHAMCPPRRTSSRWYAV